LLWIPFYTSYYTVKKITQDREVSTLDLTFLGVDVLTVAIPVSKVAGNVIRGSAETIAKDVTQETVGITVRQQLKDYTREQIAKKISIQMATNLTEKQLVPQALKEILEKYMPVISKAQEASARNTAEVTEVVQFLLQVGESIQLLQLMKQNRNSINFLKFVVLLKLTKSKWKLNWSSVS